MEEKQMDRIIDAVFSGIVNLIGTLLGALIAWGIITHFN